MNRGRLSESGPRGLYRDRENGWIFGVCAGIAEYFDVPVLVTRIVAAVGLLTLFLPTAIAYAAATLLLKKKPLTYAGRCQEYEFWRRHKSHDRWSHS